MYGVFTGQRAARIIAVPRLGPADGYALDIQALIPRLKVVRIVWLCSPNNPTGLAETPETLEYLLDIAASHPDPPLVVVDEAYFEFVGASVAPLRDRYPRGRWVPVANQHVTMKFLGTTWPRLVDGVLERVGDVAAGHVPFETRVGELGAFPSPRRARVLWLSLEDPADRLARLAASLDEALARDFPAEKRPFRPHLTVARFEPPVRLEDGLGRLAVESRPFDVAWLTLYRSHLQRPAPRYEAVATFPLGSAARDA
jgi:2'-5' RNA ligase